MALEYAQWYDIASYLNAKERNMFNEKEIACYAYDYMCDYEASKEDHIVEHSIQDVINTFLEDWHTETQNVNANMSEILQLESWLWDLFNELNLVDLDWQDYSESELYVEFVQSHFEKGK